MPHLKTLASRGAAVLLFAAAIHISSAETTPPASAAPMVQARLNAAAVRFIDGRVLVCGGRPGDTAALNTAEIYDPEQGKWRGTASMIRARYSHSVVLLRDGRVLAAGGRSATHGDSLASVEIFDPRTEHWRSAAPMRHARDAFGMILLPDGRVLAAGGYSARAGIGDQMAEAEIYDPAADRWTEVESLRRPRCSPAVAVLDDGRAVVVGGSDQAVATNETAAFDARTRRWTALAALPGANETPAAVLLFDGRLLVAGGYASGRFLRQTYIYEAPKNRWFTAGGLDTPRFGHGLVRVGRCAAAIGGGSSRAVFASSEVFDPVKVRWSRGPSLTVPRIYAVFVPLDDARVLVAGGGGDQSPIATSEILDFSGHGCRFEPGVATAW